MMARSTRIVPIVFFMLAMAGGVGPKLLLAAPEEGDRKGPPAISAEDFLASPAAELFQTQQYEQALEALESLLKQYPEDPLLLRYQAMILDRLGRSQEAIPIFQDLLQRDPEHAPTRYFLGQSYQRTGDQESAVREWRWVERQAAGTPYEEWARTAIEQVGVPPVRIRPPVKRWSLATRYGYEFDSNVILRPNDEDVAIKREQDAGRYTFDLRARYRVFTRRDLAVDFFYDFRQSLHDNSLNEFNFTGQVFGLGVRKRVNVFDRDVVLGGRYDFIPGFLDGDIFSLRNEWTLSADARLTPLTRTVLFDRLSVSDFGPDGSDTSRTSRDGFYHDVGVTQYWYSRDFKRYFFVREEFNGGHTRGNNFDRVGNTTRVGVHTPLFRKTDLDLSGGLQLRFYPNFDSLSSLDTSRRRDVNWDIYATLTHHLTPNLSLRGFYRFINGTNRNNFFDYDRHTGGVQVIYSL